MKQARNPSKQQIRAQAGQVESLAAASPYLEIKHPILIGAAILAALALLMFADTIFSSSRVPSQLDEADLSLFFVQWRDFGFRELAHGNLALWNPYLYSGTPFFGDFQSALLYPLNWIYMLLPLRAALTFDFTLHTFLIGFFMYLWGLRRGLHWLAALVAGILLMFGGAGFMHVRAGHLSLWCAAAWSPLVFLACDEILKHRKIGWVLFGSGAVAMQIYAGHPQTVFYTAVTAFLYVAFFVWQIPANRERLRVAVSLISVYLVAALLSAIQLAAGAQAAAESTRGAGGLPYEKAAMFSLPIENLATFLAPWFFGNGPPAGMPAPLAYWGRCYLWEMELFFGVTGLSLAILGAVVGERSRRKWLAAIVALLILLALGGRTPLLHVLYALVPGFDRFRGNSKFIYEASIFLSLLAGVGLDRLLRTGYSNRKLWLVFMGLACAVSMIGVMIFVSSSRGIDGGWSGIMAASDRSDESLLSSDKYKETLFIRQAGAYAAKGLWVCGATLGLLGGLFFLRRFSRHAVLGIATLAVAEVFVFARLNRSSFELGIVHAPEFLRLFRDNHPGDYRIMAAEGFENAGMSVGLESLAGYNPQIGRRYHEFLQFPADTKLDPAKRTRLFNLVRGRYSFYRDGLKVNVHEFTDPMPHLQLLGSYTVMSGGEKILNALVADSFDPRRQVILEKAPVPEPAGATELGEARIVRSSTDSIEIEADVKNPAILLIADSYNAGWRARAAADSSQSRYQVLPADYVLRAVPLQAGKHHFNLEFVPQGYAIGRWITIFSWVGFLGACAWEMKETRSMKRKN